MNSPLSWPADAVSAAGFRAWLAALPEDRLRSILRHRPDATVPLPPGIAPLATRLQLRASIGRALGTCNAAELAAIEKAANAGAEFTPVKSADVAEPSVLEGLYNKALFYNPVDAEGPNETCVILPKEVVPALPRDFSLAQQTPVDPDTIASLSEKERSILSTLAAGGGVGSSRDAGPDADPARPVPQLLAKGLLHRVDAQTVRMPRSVRNALNGRYSEPIPLTPSGRQRLGDLDTDGEAVALSIASDINEAGAAAGLNVVRNLARLIDYLGSTPIELLKDKSVGVRPRGQVAKALGLGTEEVARLITLGFSARLLSRGEPKGGPEGNFLAPTAAAEEWQDTELGAQWQTLLEAWRASTWMPWATSRVLDPESANEHLPRHREKILDVYARSTAALTEEEFSTDLRFNHPLFALLNHPDLIQQLRQEAEWIGAIALGAGTRVLHDPAAAIELTPAPVNQFIAQADMTVLVPGPLTPELQRTMELLAELESPGLASVYRLTDSSLRRGLDSGMTKEEIHSFFSDHAIGEVPHTISYLVDDVARRHGTLRAGNALSYIRSDDPSLIAQAVHAITHLRAIAPTVAVSEQPIHKTLDALRAAGFSPAAEDSSGASIAARRSPALLPTPRAKNPTSNTSPETRVEAALKAIRGGADSGSTSPAETEGPDLDLLHAAARAGRSVLLGYADKNGAINHTTVTPLSVSGGQVDAHASGKTVRFPLHRITSVALA